LIGAFIEKRIERFEDQCSDLLGGRDLIAGHHGGHLFKHPIASNQCVEQGSGDMQQDQSEEWKGEIEVPVPQQLVQVVALRQKSLEDATL
jgi:hypothetical protein